MPESGFAGLKNGQEIENFTLMENQIEIYKSSLGVEVSVILENETVWATQR